jgi:hypothetical protein
MWTPPQSDYPGKKVLRIEWNNGKPSAVFNPAYIKWLKSNGKKDLLQKALPAPPKSLVDTLYQHQIFDGRVAP